MAGHEHERRDLRERDELFHLRAARRRRLLDERVLAGFQRAPGKLVVRRNRGRDHDAVDRLVGEQLVVVRVDARAWVARGVAPAQVIAEVAQRAERAELVEVPREVRAQ
jgi:hypothetical protein